MNDLTKSMLDGDAPKKREPLTMADLQPVPETMFKPEDGDSAMPPVDVMHAKDAEGRHYTISHIAAHGDYLSDPEHVYLRIGTSIGVADVAELRIPTAVFG